MVKRRYFPNRGTAREVEGTVYPKKYFKYYNQILYPGLITCKFSQSLLFIDFFRIVAKMKRD